MKLAYNVDRVVAANAKAAAREKLAKAETQRGLSISFRIDKPSFAMEEKERKSMKCENCNSEFTIKELAKAEGRCPSCGLKLPAADNCDDVQARTWYRYHSPMPLSLILAYGYLVGGGMLAWQIVLESVDLGLWTGIGPAGWLFVITVALVFLLPFFALFFTPSARRWRAIIRGDRDRLAYEAAVKSDEPTLLKCKTCHSEFTLWKLAWKKGYCPSCGEKIPVSEYCPGVPDRGWRRLFRGAPLGLKLLAIFLALLCGWTVVNLFLSDLTWMVEFRDLRIRGIAVYVFLLLMLSRMLKTVLRGGISWVGIMLIWWTADLFQGSLAVLLAVVSFIFSFSLPAWRHWARKIREGDLAYWIAARSGAFPFRRMVAKYILKNMAIGVLLLHWVVYCIWFKGVIVE